MSIASDRLPRFDEMKRAENSFVVPICARLRRVMSPPIGSTFSTSAPWSARSMVAMGPDTTPVRSNTRTPDSDPDMSLLLLVDRMKYAHPGLHPARPGADGPDRRRQSGAERKLNQERKDILAA